MLHLKGLLAVGNRLVLVSGLLVLCLLCRCIMWHLHPWNEKNCSFIALLNHSKTADENLSNLDLLFLFFFLLLRHFKSWLEFTEKNKICLIVRVQILAPCFSTPSSLLQCFMPSSPNTTTSLGHIAYMFKCLNICLLNMMLQLGNDWFSFTYILETWKLASLASPKVTEFQAYPKFTE